MNPAIPLGEDGDWSRVEPLLLRAETLLQTAADSLDRQREQTQRERERIAGALDDLHGSLAGLRLELISLVEEMAADAPQAGSLRWQGRLQGQLPGLERLLIELERLLVRHTDHSDPAEGEGLRHRLVRLELEEMLERRHQQVIELHAEVERLEGIVQAAGLAADAAQERGSM